VPEEEKTLTIVAQREVAFYGDELVAVKEAGGRIYVSVRHLCSALGLNSQSQTRRILRQPILANGYTANATIETAGGPQRAGVLLVDMVPLWLAGINTNSVRDEVRPKLERYQREAAKVLWEAFQEGRLTASPSFDELLESDTQAVRAYKTALAIVELARQQVLMEARLTDHERRLEAIEAQLGDPGRAVTPEQAAQVSQAVKAVAMALGKKSGRNEYGGVYGELYRRFDIAGYKQLPARRFQAAMEWLNEWYQNVTGTPLPF
jgi:hypothetical protein